MKRLQATGLYCGKTGLVVSFRDPNLVVPRQRSVNVPWDTVAMVHRGLVEGMEAVFVRQIEERLGEQPTLPLEKWE